MATRQYIGARYVPKIYTNSVNPSSADWEANTTYEPLTIVTYNGSSYTSRIEVPATVRNPAQNPLYWANTGNYNGQIAQLQRDIDNINEILDTLGTTRKYVLIGDSFGCGIRGGGQSWVTGWIDYLEALLPNKVFRYNPASDPTFEGTSAFTTSSQVNFIGQLNYVYTNKLGDVDPEEITDVIVLGGTNEVTSATEDFIATAIDTFCVRSKELFTNAQIGIGLLGQQGRKMVYETNVFKGYRTGAQRNGAKFLIDCLNLGTMYTYDSGYGHWSEAGYNLFNPYIAQMVIKGSCDYCFEETISGLDWNGCTTPSGVTLPAALIVQINPKHIQITLYATNTYAAVFALTNTKISGSSATRSGNMLRLHKSQLNYVYRLNDCIWDGEYYFTNDDQTSNVMIGGKCEFRIGYDSNISDFVVSYMAANPIASAATSNTYSLVMPYKISKYVNSFAV